MNYLRFLVVVISISSCSLNWLAANVVLPVADLHSSPEIEIQESKELKQISYAYKTEVVMGDIIGFELPSKVEDCAKALYKDLNDSLHFKTSFVRDTKKVRVHHIDEANPDRGQLVSVTTEDGIEIRCTFFDRGGDELVVVGPGFTNEREKMTPFVEMFKTDITGQKKGRDVILFDFRGHGYDPAIWDDYATWPNINLAKNGFGMDSRFSRVGEIEEKDVLAVVTALKAYKKYKQVCGVSLCFGSFVFLKAEAMYPGLFDKIVVDGCWDTLEKVIEKMKVDPKLLFRPQLGGWSECFLVKQSWFQDFLLWVARNVVDLNIDHGISLVKELPKIKTTPVLFFYGKNDLVVYREEFEPLWNALVTPYKVAVITSNPHVINHLKQKELYKLVCETFFKSGSLGEFGKNLFVDLPVMPDATVN